MNCTFHSLSSSLSVELLAGRLKQTKGGYPLLFVFTVYLVSGSGEQGELQQKLKFAQSINSSSSAITRFHAMKMIDDAQEGILLLPTHVIQQKAKHLEFQEVRKFQIISTSLVHLEELLDEVYSMLKPSLKDYEARKALIAFVDKFTKLKIRGSCISGAGPSVRAFGSYTMDLFTSDSDLDLSVSLGYTGDVPRENKIPILRKLTKALYGLQGGGKIHKIQPILTAIVPVLKFVDCRSGIECDISIENRDGVLKSELLGLFSSIDERFQKLCFLMKAWAKAHNINSSKDRTLNSLSIILLVALHLQTRSPPILPPFSVLLEGLCFDSAGSSIAEVERRVQQFKYFGNHNQECIAELFISLLCKLLSIESLWEQGLCASTYEGSWISKTWDDNRRCVISVEDFTSRSQNAARSVGKRECEIIYECIRESLSHLQHYMTNQSEASSLKAFLFGPQSKSENALGKSAEARHPNSKKRSIVSEEMVKKKRKRRSENDVKREDYVADRFPMMQSGDVGAQPFPRVAENIVRTAVSSLARFAVPPAPRYGQWQETIPGGRYGQWKDRMPGSSYGQQQDRWPELRHGQWEDPMNRATYDEQRDRVHLASHMNINYVALQSQTATLNEDLYSYRMGRVRLGSVLNRVNHLDQNYGQRNVNFVGSNPPTNWNRWNQSHNYFDSIGRH